MVRKVISRRFALPDLLIVLLVATAIYGVVSIAKEWSAEFQPVTEIDLSVSALPYYTLLSAIRGFVAYFISLVFTIIIGYLAAKSRAAEQMIIPALDILQSIPVLGFLPGLVLGLVSLFPKTNIGLELAAILMIFTGQVWNMTFSFYSSLKSIPSDFREASTIVGLNWSERLKRVELPFAAVNLAWNSLLSMAGGWFFLIPCEAMTLGSKEYRLPGIGSYMGVAIQQGNRNAMVLAVVAMILLIISMDFVIWRPVLAWVQRFRLDDAGETAFVEPLMQVWIRESKIVRWFKVFVRSTRGVRRLLQRKKMGSWSNRKRVWQNWDLRFFSNFKRWILNHQDFIYSLRLFQILGAGLLFLLIGYGTFQLLTILLKVPPRTWLTLIEDMLWTLGRVMGAVLMSSIWAVPVGIWIGTSSKRIRIAQPIIQVFASFPAPMLYPIVLSAFFFVGMKFEWASMFLILLGIQWYILFNVLVGSLRIPQELKYAMSLMKASRWDRWRVLYLPSIFPALATGWISAAGGAWNASVVAEYIYYQGSVLKARGLGSALIEATEKEDFVLFAATLTLMVSVVILLNRLVWSKIYHVAQTRYRME